MKEDKSPLSAEDFLERGPDSVVLDTGEHDCHNYFNLFTTRAQVALDAGDEVGNQVFLLLSNLCSMHLEPASKDNPLVPMFESREVRSAALNDFKNHELQILEQVVPDIVDAELKARMADVVWMRLRRFQMARSAVNAYKASSTTLLAEGHWVAAKDRLERALRLATMLGKSGQELANEVVQQIETAIASSGKSTEAPYLAGLFMELLLEFRAGDFAHYADLSCQLAEEAELVDEWQRAEDYWKFKARWDVLRGDEQGNRDALVRAAESSVRMAEIRLENSPPDLLVASVFLQKAFEQFRRVGEKERASEIHRRLIEVQGESRTQLGVVSQELDITKHVENATAQVTGKTLFDALFTLAQIAQSPSVEMLAEQADKIAKEMPVLGLFPTKILNEEGKVIAQPPTRFSNDPEVVEEARLSEMFSSAGYFQDLHAAASIQPACRQILLEHRVQESDFLSIVANNPVVPLGREEIFARGLYSGLIGDFMIAANLLVPQIENSLRNLLSRVGITTSNLTSEGVQEEIDLNGLFKRFKPTIDSILGQDLAFDLEGLLISRFGSNIRNRQAHGLISYDGFQALRMVYLWWLVLRLCFLPIIVQIAEREAQRDDTGLSPETMGQATDDTDLEK